jgi:hypothetical protein
LTLAAAAGPPPVAQVSAIGQREQSHSFDLTRSRALTGGDRPSYDRLPALYPDR